MEEPLLRLRWPLPETRSYPGRPGPGGRAAAPAAVAAEAAAAAAVAQSSSTLSANTREEAPRWALAPAPAEGGRG